VALAEQERLDGGSVVWPSMAGFRWPRVRRQPQVGAEHVDALLLLFIPIVGKACHRADSGEPDGGFVAADEICGVLVAAAEQSAVVAMAAGLVDAGASVSDDQGGGGADAGGQSEGDLDEVGEQVCWLAIGIFGWPSPGRVRCQPTPSSWARSM